MCIVPRKKKHASNQMLDNRVGIHSSVLQIEKIPRMPFTNNTDIPLYLS